MPIDYTALRSQPRHEVPPGTIVEIRSEGEPVSGSVIDRSPSGILIEFPQPVAVDLGEWVTIDLVAGPSSDQPLPYWGVGKVVSIEENRVALFLDVASLVDTNGNTQGLTS
jgi:hypothetical protein